MSVRGVALGAFVVAILAFVFVVPGARARALAAEGELRRVSSELAEVRAQLADAERRSGLRALAFEGSTPTGGKALTALRSEVVEALSGLELSRVRLSVSPARAPAVVSLSLQAQGTQSEVLQLLERLAHPAGPLILADVSLRPVVDEGVLLSLAGFNLGGR